MRKRETPSPAITEADTNTTVQAIHDPAESYVEDVAIIVTEAFAGGTPSLDVDDGDDADGWIDTADITEATIGAYKGTEVNAGAYAKTGRWYPTAETIDVVVSASLTDGTACVRARFMRLDEIV